MTTAGQFITALQAEQNIGNVSSETEQHLKHEFRKLGRDASRTMLADAVDAEINRLERQAATLRDVAGRGIDGVVPGVHVRGDGPTVPRTSPGGLENRWRLRGRAGEQFTFMRMRWTGVINQVAKSC